MADEIEVTVSDNETPEETPTVVDTSDTVVVVPPAAESGPSDAVLERLMQTDERINRILETQEGMAQAIAALAANQAATVEAVEETQEQVDEVAAEQVDDDDEIEPRTTHPWFRSLSEWTH